MPHAGKYPVIVVPSAKGDKGIIGRVSKRTSNNEMKPREFAQLWIVATVLIVIIKGIFHKVEKGRRLRVRETI